MYLFLSVGMVQGNLNIPCVDCNQQTVARVREIFQRICLEEFFVVNVSAQKCPGTTPCRWVVSYKFRDPNRQYEGGQFAKQLVRRFDARKPPGTNLMKPAISLIIPDNDGPCYSFTYGVLCECELIEMPCFGVDDDGPVDISEINIGA
ncbi:hypothetical protein Zmor_006385 [Zophobas morio]|uniref:Uncharacterized protein n=1 Tax=Zophobas morio TaxID=2755281 RepID=A0AA38MNG9_9CUCU|nr:hypothetical protein Zmor_006385 [Zophobas morio]